MLLRAYRDGTDPRLAGGWLPTGDAGRLEDDGTLVVFGRMAEVIVTGAEKVWPAPVEDVLAGHPASPRWRCGSGPTPSGASGWWPGWCPAAGRRRPGLDELRELVGATGWPAGPRPASWSWSTPCPAPPGGKVRRAELLT